MKYGYKNIADKNLIQHYEISDDKIIIKYLDGNVKTIPLTKENESDLLNLMFKQAKDRSTSSALKNARNIKDLMESLTIKFGSCTALGIILAAVSSSPNVELYSSILSCVVSMPLIFCGVKCVNKNNEIKELEKYDMYLSLKNTLEKNISQPNLFNEVKNKQNVLNINTLDNYSLDDIETIKRNLILIESSSICFDEASDVKKLEKKISK